MDDVSMLYKVTSHMKAHMRFVSLPGDAEKYNSPLRSTSALSTGNPNKVLTFCVAGIVSNDSKFTKIV